MQNKYVKNTYMKVYLEWTMERKVNLLRLFLTDGVKSLYSLN